jgi:hypothetical protein
VEVGLQLCLAPCRHVDPHWHAGASRAAAARPLPEFKTEEERAPPVPRSRGESGGTGDEGALASTRSGGRRVRRSAAPPLERLALPPLARRCRRAAPPLSPALARGSREGRTSTRGSCEDSGRRRGCPSSIAGDELDTGACAREGAEEQRMGAAKEQRIGEEWTERKER